MERLTTKNYADLIKCLDCAEYSQCFDEECGRIDDAIELLRQYENTGLTPEQIRELKERLPEDGTYLCTLAGELCGIEEPFTGMCGIENGIWDEPDCVIAWHPLPEPYRPERSEG